MAEQPKSAPTAEELKIQQDADAAKLKADADAKAEADAGGKENNTVGNLFKGKKKEGGKVVPESVFLEQKRQLKEAQEEVARLKDSGASPKEVNKSLKEIAEKYDVDEEFVNDIASNINKDAEAKIDERISSKLKPLEEKENREKVDKVFAEHYDKTLADMPEYKDIISRDVIKTMSLDPENANLTFAQIFEKAFGHLVKGIKKPIEKTRPKDGGSNVTIDFNRAKNDPAYFKEIMADPELKAEYNKDMHKRNKF